MAVAIGGKRRASRGRRGVPRYGAMADINMTPFIDVMLVLLIIFMVAAPLLTSGVSVDLPQAKASALNVDQKPIAISLNDQGQLFLMDQPIADSDLTAKLLDVSGGSTDQRIYMRASKVVSYGRVAQIMGAVTAAGFKKVALVTEPDSKP